MNAAWVIATRELRDKSRLFIASIALAVLPFAATLLPATRGGSRGDVIAIGGGILAVAMGLGVAAIFGATTIGRPLSEGRLSFYFTKPVSPAAIWIGKAAAAMVAAIGSFLIIIVPAVLASEEHWMSMWERPWGVFVALVAGGGTILFLVMHAASSMIRSRSALIALDFVLLVLACSAAMLLLQPLMAGMALDVAKWVVVALASGAVLALAVAPVWQLSRGRTDRRRGHVELSKFLWSTIAVVLLLAAFYVAWVVYTEPSDLKSYEVAQFPSTGLLYLGGRAGGARGEYHSAFLIHPAKPRDYERIPAPFWGEAVSRDGSTLVWARAFLPRADQQLELLRWRDGKISPAGVTTGAHRFILSHDGNRLAVFDEKNVSVHDLQADRLLASVPVPPDSVHAGWFLAPDRVRLVLGSRAGKVWRPSLFELDVTRRKLTKLADVEPVEHLYVTASEDGSRLLFRGGGLLVDGNSGATIARLPRRISSTVLPDGTVAIADHEAVTFYSRDGVKISEARVPRLEALSVRGQIAPGRVLVNGRNGQLSEQRARGWQAFIVNVATGAVERTERDIRGPLVSGAWPDPRPLRFDNGQPLAAFDADGRVVLWTPMTGEKRVLMP